MSFEELLNPKTDKDTVNLNEIRENIEKSAPRLQEEVVELFNVIRTCQPSTLFFMDKSSRPLAAIFHDLWQELVANGQISDEKKPEIRFIDIGRFQSEDRYQADSPAMKAANEKYQVAPDGLILVVDDFSDTGQSLAQAEVAFKHLFPDQDVLYHATFFYNTPWHDFPTLFGVEDPPTDDENLWIKPYKHENLNPEQTHPVKRFRQMLNETITQPALKRLQKGDLHLKRELPRSYSDPFIKSRLQIDLDQKNMDVLSKLGITKD